MHDHSEHSGPPAAHPRSINWTKTLAIGSALALGAVIIAPYVLPLVGIGSADMAEEAMLALHGTGAGSGVAGAVNYALGALPGVGSALARGGLITAATAGVIGIGGVLLGRYIEKHDDGTRRLRWGKIIKTAALLTTALIALPSLLTGISTGIVFLCRIAADAELASSAATFLANTLGSTGTVSLTASGVSGAALTLPHLLTCGASIAPACIAWAMGGRRAAPAGDADNAGIECELLPQQPVKAGQDGEVKVMLRDKKTGHALTDSELAISHTKKLHLLVVDSSLRDYQHIHPLATSKPGVFTFHFTPKTGNSYRAWADFTLVEKGKNYRIPADLPIAGARRLQPRIKANQRSEIAGLQAEWKGDALSASTASVIEISINDLAGKPVTDLEPVMGAFAHLVGFSADGKSLIHCHPLGVEPVSKHERGGPKLRFHIEPESKGPTQFYLQIQRNGEEVFIPFGQIIKSPTSALEHRMVHQSAMAR